MKQPTESKTFCILPWIHVNSTVSGKYRPCCNSHASWSINDKDLSIKEAFHSSEMQEVREAMSRGEKHQACMICYQTEEQGGLSPRHTYTVDKFKKHVDANKEESLKYLDMRFNNVCNLACRMCDPVSSNQLDETVFWYKDNNKELPTVWKNFQNYKSKDMTLMSETRKDYVKELINDIEYFKVTGGEPFLSKDFLDVLDFFIETDKAKNITLSITTNGTKFVKSVLNRLKYFKGLDLNVSVDGTNEVYDYIRYPFTWEKWTERFREFLTFADQNKLYENNNFRVRTSTIVSSYNWLNCPELYNTIKAFGVEYPWLVDINFIPRIDFNLHVRPSESGLNIKWLPNEILDAGLKLWEQTDYRDVKHIRNYVEKSKKIDIRLKAPKQKDFVHMTKTLDEQRNQNFNILSKDMIDFIERYDG